MCSGTKIAIYVINCLSTTYKQINSGHNFWEIKLMSQSCLIYTTVRYFAYIYRKSAHCDIQTDMTKVLF